MKQLIYIFSVLIPFVGLCQKPSVSLSADTKNVQIGDPITFTVKSNVEGNVEIVFPDEFIQGYGSMNGMEQEMDYNSGTVHTIYYFSQNGAFKENGTYTIYAYVKNRKAIYKSNKLTVKVEKEPTQKNEEEISRKNLKQPVFGIIQKSKSKIYEGESVVLEAKVYSRLNINMLEAYQAFEFVGNAESKDLGKSSNLLLSRENFKGNQVLTFTYGKQLVFPSAPGKYKIKPFEMALQYTDGGIFSERIAFTSNGASIEVLPLPAGAPKDFIGGVGKFDLDYEINKSKTKQGEVIELSLTISGKGNLQNINKPKLNLPKGVVVYGDPEVVEEIEYGVNWAEGKIRYRYNLQFLEAENEKLDAISISYFDPELKKYVTKTKDGFSIEVIPSKNASIKLPEAQQVEKSEEKIPFIEEAFEESSNFYDSNLFWPSVLSPLALAFLSGFVIIRRKKMPSKEEKSKQKNNLLSLQKQLQEATLFYQKGEVKAAYSALEDALKVVASILAKDPDFYFSKQGFIDLLQENGVGEELISQTKVNLVKFEEARYSFDEQAIAASFTSCLDSCRELIKSIS
jgi:hypothetical protein